MVSFADIYYVYVSLDAPTFKVTSSGDFHFFKEGANTTLNCEAEGNPPPLFNWTHDGVHLLEKTSHLNLTRVDNSAIYNCTAYNHLGSITKSMNIQVIKTAKSTAPAAMTTPQALAAAAETLTPTYSESTTATPETPTPTYSKSTTVAPETPTPTSIETTTEEGGQQ